MPDMGTSLGPGHSESKSGLGIVPLDRERFRLAVSSLLLEIDLGKATGAHPDTAPQARGHPAIDFICLGVIKQ